MLQIPDWIDFEAALYPQTVALAEPFVTLTYGQLSRGSIAAARKLKDQGVARGHTAAVQAVSPGLQLILMLALHRLGVTACMLPQEAPRRRAGLEALSFDWLITAHDEKISTAPVIPVGLDWLTALQLTDAVWPGGFESADEISLISISSGTTSPPKPMPFTLEVLEKRIVWRSWGGDLITGHGSKTMVMGGLGTMNGFLSLMGVLWCGGTAYMGWPPDQVPGLVADEKIERLFSSVYFLARTLEAARAGAVMDFSSLKLIHAGGDFLSAHLVRQVTQSLCPNLQADFGTNEVGRIAMKSVGVAGFHAQDAGPICPWAQVQAVNEKDEVLPPGREGHLRFKSPLMVPGYLNHPEATQKRFRNGWFYSDDIGWVTADRMLVVSGRATEFIQTGEDRFNPVEIDQAVAGHPAIIEAAAFGVLGTDTLHEIWLALVPRTPITDAELRAFCAEKLGARAPRHFVRMDALPRSETGKVMRHLLAQMARKTRAPAS